MTASMTKPARRKYSSMRCQTLIFRSGISMSATSSKVLQSKIACVNSSAFPQSPERHSCDFGYRLTTISCNVRKVMRTGFSSYSFSISIIPRCIPINPRMPFHRMKLVLMACSLLPLSRKGAC